MDKEIHKLIDIDIEVSGLMLALKLSKLAEEYKENNRDGFELFRSFAKEIRNYENKKEKRVINEQSYKYNF
jgi:hypothetical protein